MSKLDTAFKELMSKINEDSTSIADDKVSSKFDKELNVWLSKGKDSDHTYHSDKDEGISKEYSKDLSKDQKEEVQEPMKVGSGEPESKTLDADKVSKWIESSPKEFEELIVKRDLEGLTLKAMEHFKVDEDLYDTVRQTVKEALKI